MAKCISGLQKKILLLAYQSPKRTNGVCLYSYEAKEKIFGFGFSTSFRPSCGSHNFSKQVIGKSKYNSASVSICRAFGRLEKRGLVTVFKGTVSHWSGIGLTEDGIKEAEKLSRLEMP